MWTGPNQLDLTEIKGFWQERGGWEGALGVSAGVFESPAKYKRKLLRFLPGNKSYVG